MALIKYESNSTRYSNHTGRMNKITKQTALDFKKAGLEIMIDERIYCPDTGRTRSKLNIEIIPYDSPAYKEFIERFSFIEGLKKK